jgi:transposase
VLFLIRFHSLKFNLVTFKVVWIFTAMEPSQENAGSASSASARSELIHLMQQGLSYNKAAQRLSAPIKKAMAYRLLKQFRQQGERALIDGRHGHPSKFRGEPLNFLVTYCRQNPDVPSSQIQPLLLEKFQFSPSLSQINRLRAAHNLTNRAGFSPHNSTNARKKTKTAKRHRQ